ncbi:MAG: aminotransferase class III-fold pyridoxal phosphate-dependent enzyme [Dehalococcoidia bacterium]|nr:aminotransferase class III-fold pyridoxal phosphate-dependent enzyme [Dehalococcoidia bacterium]
MVVTNSLNKFIATHQKSMELTDRSFRVSRGLHTDAIFTTAPYIYIKNAKGSRKWDVDGNEYIDYVMGFGALLLGHTHPAMVEAVMTQITKGTHYGAENELELEWAELICQLIPSAERVEFMLSGSESNMLIAALARAYTGRKKILKFAEQYFGWADDLLPGIAPPYDKPFAGHIPPISEDAVAEGTVVIPCNNEMAMEKALAKGDIAALFIEGGGANCGRIGMPPELVHKARRLTQENGTILVIDEVISGFRWSPGGYQAAIGVTPDISTLAKLNSGGIPGGAAVCGRADIMELLWLKPGDVQWNRYRHVIHRGTWNGNPLTASTAVAMLKIVAQGEVQKTAEARAKRLVTGINREIEKRNVDACAHNSTSVVHIFIGKCEGCDKNICLDTTKSMPPEVVHTLNRQLLLNGVHFHRGTMGLMSAVHTEEDIDQTVAAFGAAFDGMLEERIIKAPK